MRRSHNFIKQALRNAELFEMLSDEQLDQAAAAGKIRKLRRGKLLFRAGDSSDMIHILLEGALEILRPTPDNKNPVPVAYLSPGEVIGDMALFTGAERRSSGRVPEYAVVWTLDKKSFGKLAEKISGYGMQIATVFARRLESFIMHSRRQSTRKELAGKLKYFDMPTVVQTLVSSKQTGILTLLDRQGDTSAEVVLVDGSIERARCGNLEGEEAFYQLFLAEESGEFAFRNVSEPNLDAVSRQPITLSAMNLLMEAMRLMDELPEVQQRLPERDKAYEAKTEELSWEEEQTARIAGEILERLQTSTKLEELEGEVACSTFTLYRVAADLYETKQIA